jgi:thymidylate synthase (FAD)
VVLGLLQNSMKILETKNDDLEDLYTMDLIKVLDLGYVKLADVSGGIGTITRAARISRKSGRMTPEDNIKLVNWMLSNTPPHLSPFEFASICFRIKAPLFVARQLHRHRLASIMEMSMRYVEATPDFYVPEEPYGTPLYESHIQISFGLYQKLLDMGWPKERARMVLGTGVYTEWYWRVNVREFMHVLNLRTHEAAQWETRQFVKAMESLWKEEMPIIHEAWDKYLRLDSV